MGVSRHARVRIALVVGLVVAACGAPTPPAMTAPPPPAGVPAWPELVWTPTTFAPLDQGMPNERLMGVAAADGMLVAVGQADGGGRQAGRIWWSTDGADWTRVDDAFVDQPFIDVAAGPGGFVALGDRVDAGAGGLTQPVMYHSPDGRSWSQVALPLLANGYATTVAGSPDGYAALAWPDSGEAPAMFLSDDGVRWEAAPSGVDAGAPTSEVVTAAPDGGWLTGGRSPSGALAIGHLAADGMWTVTDLEPRDTNGQAVTELLVGPNGWLAMGIASDGCSPMASCPGEWVAWWSADGSVWGRQPRSDLVLGEVAVGVHPERGFVAVGLRAISSPDGWTWTSVGDPQDGQFGPTDLAIVGDRVVVAGIRYALDGTQHRAALLVGAPD